MSAGTGRVVPARVLATAQRIDLAKLPANVRRLPTAALAPVAQPQRRGRHGQGVMPIHTLRRQRREAALQAGPATWLELEKPQAHHCLSEQEAALVEAAKAALARGLAGRSGPLLSDSDTMRDLCYLHLASLDHERFAVAFLDTQLRLIAFEVMFSGSLSETAVYPREVARRALACNAAAVVVSHNHPSGCLEPSTADLSLTNLLHSSLELVGVRLVDHVIVGGSGSMSFADRGLI